MASADGFVFDFGLVYKTGYRSIQTSAVIRNFGPEISFSDDEITTNNSDFESYPPPQTLAIGVSSFLIAPDNSLLLQSGNQRLRVAFDIIGPRDYDQQYNTGLASWNNDCGGFYSLNLEVFPDESGRVTETVLRLSPHWC